MYYCVGGCYHYLWCWIWINSKKNVYGGDVCIIRLFVGVDGINSNLV